MRAGRGSNASPLHERTDCTEDTSVGTVRRSAFPRTHLPARSVAGALATRCVRARFRVKLLVHAHRSGGAFTITVTVRCVVSRQTTHGEHAQRPGATAPGPDLMRPLDCGSGLRSRPTVDRGFTTNAVRSKGAIVPSAAMNPGKSHRDTGRSRLRKKDASRGPDGNVPCDLVVLISSAVHSEGITRATSMLYAQCAQLCGQL